MFFLKVLNKCSEGILAKNQSGNQYRDKEKLLLDKYASLYNLHNIKKICREV